MKTTWLFPVLSMLGVGLVMSPMAQAAEIQVLGGGAMTAPLRELATQFERTAGHELAFRFGTTPELIRLATSGGAFDLGVVPREVFNNAEAKARFVSGPTTDIARVGLGVAVRSGARKPDIHTPDALKQTLLKAHPSPLISEEAVQQPFKKSLTADKTTDAAWRGKQSFYAVSTQDRTINPDLERFMAKRMGAKTIEIEASHLALISHPDAITNLILEALAV